MVQCLPIIEDAEDEDRSRGVGSKALHGLQAYLQKLEKKIIYMTDKDVFRGFYSIVSPRLVSFMRKPLWKQVSNVTTE